jgi:choline dehydrogenase-like flavoprotein
MTIDRRTFIQLAGASGLLGLAAGPLRAAERLAGRGKSPRVVIVGAGFGGATAAKYLRMWSENKIEVLLVERQKNFISCPMSNTVLGGSRSMADITLSYDDLTKKHGVLRVQAEVTAIDPAKRTLRTARGELPYDRLILAPGIDFMFEQINGLDANVAETQIPHAWKAGPQTALLRKQCCRSRKRPTAVRPGPTSALAKWLSISRTRSRSRRSSCSTPTRTSRRRRACSSRPGTTSIRV